MASSLYSLAFTVGSDITYVVGHPDPDNGGTTWTALVSARSVSGHFAGEDNLLNVDNFTGNDATSFIAPIVVAPTNSSGSTVMGTTTGSVFRRLDVGDGIEVSVPVQMPSGNWPVATNFLHVALSTCCDVINPGKGEITVSAVDDATGTMTIDAADIAACAEGTVIAASVDGTVYYALIVENDGVDTITTHPRIPDPAGAVGTADYRLCVTYSPRDDAPSADNLVWLRGDMSGLTHYINGCAVGQLRLEVDGDSGGLLMTTVMRPQDAKVYQGANASANSYTATLLSTPLASRTQSCFHYTAALASPNAEPTTLAASDLTIRDDWSITVDFKRNFPQACGGLSMEGPPSYTRSEVTATGTTETVAPFLTWLKNREHRTLVYGFGPPQRGAAFIIPAAHLRETEVQDEDTDTDTRTVSFSARNGTFTGLEDGTGPTWVFAVPYNATIA